MSTEAARFTTADLDAIQVPEGWRVEIIEGELVVSKQPSWAHQDVLLRLAVALAEWSERTRLGRPSITPGVIYPDGDNVAPDLVWVSHQRLVRGLDAAGHLIGDGPELVVEILSPGLSNEERDRQRKLALYSRHAVVEYWIVDPLARAVEVYQRSAAGAPLRLTHTLVGGGTPYSTPLLPGFGLRAEQLFPPSTDG